MDGRGPSHTGLGIRGRGLCIVDEVHTMLKYLVVDYIDVSCVGGWLMVPVKLT
jgi:hypothetical protein